jgi:hypothetical protein
MADIASEAAAQIADEVIPMAELGEHDGKRFPAVVAHFGADLYTYSADWLTRVRGQLEAERAAG